MARLTADLADYEEFSPADKAVYDMHVSAMERGTSKAGNAMLTLSWKLDNHEQFGGREIRFDTVVLSGVQSDKSKNPGAPIVPFRLMDLIQACKLPWMCGACEEESSRPWLVGTGSEGDKANGLPKGKLHCPDCQAGLKLSFDDDHVPGARCKGAVDIEEGKNGKNFNKIVKYLPAD